MHAMVRICREGLESLVAAYLEPEEALRDARRMGLLHQAASNAGMASTISIGRNAPACG